MGELATAAAILGLSAAAGKEAAAVVGQFTRDIFGPSAKALGDGMAAPLRAWADKRAKNAERVIVDAALILNDAGRHATEVPGRVLLPLLTAASVEDDIDLRRMWATLLANAADSARSADMLPGFVSILSELTPAEALILESAYFQSRDDPNHIGYVPGEDGTVLKIYAGKGPEAMREVALPFGNYKVLVDNLARLGLIAQVFAGQTTVGALETNRDYYSGLTLSPLGHHFVQACVIQPSTKHTPTS